MYDSHQALRLKPAPSVLIIIKASQRSKPMRALSKFLVEKCWVRHRSVISYSSHPIIPSLEIKINPSPQRYPGSASDNHFFPINRQSGQGADPGWMKIVLLGTMALSACPYWLFHNTDLAPPPPPIDANIVQSQFTTSWKSHCLIMTYRYSMYILPYV